MAESVLVFSDLGDAGDEAVRQAHAWSLALGARLVVCHVAPNLLGTSMLFPQELEGRALAQAELEAKIADELRARVVSLTGRPPDDFDVIVDEGSPESELVREARGRNAELVTVGEQVLSASHLGGVAAHVVEETHRPLLVARAHEPSRHWLVDVTSIQQADDTLALIAPSARRAGARLTLLSNLEPELGVAEWMTSFGANYAFVPVEEESMRERLQSELTHLLEQAQLDGEVRITQGKPVACILDAALAIDAELVVVGWAARRRRRPPSVARHVVDGAHCSVLVTAA